MASPLAPPAPASPLLRGGVAQRLRLASGLILFAFVLAHLANHALGIWSVQAMETVQAWRTAVTQSLPGSVLLAAALITHMALNFYKIATRSTWRMPAWQAAQIGFGLLIPLFLFPHVGRVLGRRLTGADTGYSELLPAMWESVPLPQMLLIVVVWAHACIGLHYWLRLARFYRPFAPLLLAFAVLVPALALAGFTAAGRSMVERAAAAQPPLQDYGRPAVDSGAAGAGSAQATDTWTPDNVGDLAARLALAYLAALALAIALRALLQKRHRRIRVVYAEGPAVTTPVGPTLLEISRMSGVPHAAVCGGRARCSTCRVRIETTAADLPPRTPPEAATLERIGAEDDIRLACQLRPRGDLTVTRLVRVPEARLALSSGGSEEAGMERTLAILFLDIRGFTTISEARLPYDTVFLLNRFFAEVGEATIAAGGWIDKYLGDGLMALFGLHGTSEQASRQALSAAMQIDAAVERLNQELHGEVSAPLRIGIGLHVGPLVLGRIGHQASAATTVIGPAVNVASRLETLTKEHDVQIVVSSTLAEKAGIAPDAFPKIDVAVRGVSTPVSVMLIGRGRDLAGLLDEAARQSAA